MSGRGPRRGAGDVMLHPVVVGAVLVMLTNDHVFKRRWPGVLTGKLSDVAGLVFFPLLLVAVAEIYRSWMGLTPPSRRFVATCVGLTGLVFAAAEIVPFVGGALELAWGWTRSPVGPLTGRSVRSVVMVADPTDLLTLPALWIAWTIGSSRTPPRTTVNNVCRRCLGTELKARMAVVDGESVQPRKVSGEVVLPLGDPIKVEITERPASRPRQFVLDLSDGLIAAFRSVQLRP